MTKGIEILCGSLMIFLLLLNELLYFWKLFLCYLANILHQTKNFLQRREF